MWQLAEIEAHETMKIGDLRGSRERRETWLRVKALAIREMGQRPAWLFLSSDTKVWLRPGLELLLCVYDLRQKGPHCGKWGVSRGPKLIPGKHLRGYGVF